MKKIFLCLTLSLLFLFGCSCKSREVTLTVRGISFSAEISYYNESYICNVNIDRNGKMTLTADSPEDLKGLTLTYTGNEVTAEYMGLTYTPRSGSMPLGNVAESIYGIIGDIEKEVETAPATNGNCTVENNYNGKSYTFVFSPAGLPLSLEIPDSSFKILFNNVTVISE